MVLEKLQVFLDGSYFSALIKVIISFVVCESIKKARNHKQFSMRSNDSIYHFIFPNHNNTMQEII